MRLTVPRAEHGSGAVVAAGEHISISNEPRLGLNDREGDRRQLKLTGLPFSRASVLMDQIPSFMSSQRQRNQFLAAFDR